MKTLSQRDWTVQLINDDNAVVLDVRTPAEYADGIIENALCLDFFQKDKFMQEIEKLDKSKNYYIYCRSGNRSGMACQLLAGMDFKNTYNLEGGVLQWQGNLV